MKEGQFVYELSFFLNISLSVKSSRFYLGFLSFRYIKKTQAKCLCLCVEKAVNLEKRVLLHAEQTSRNRGEFRFLASGSCTRVLPPSKKRKTPNSGKDLISLPLFFVKIPQSERDGEDTVPYKRKCYAAYIYFGVVQPTLSTV